MLKKIGHLGLAVRNIDQALTAFSKVLDLPMPQILDVPEKKMKVAVLNLQGVSLEFLEDYSDDGPIRKLVAERGNAIHHFCMEADDIEEEIETLVSRGAQMQDRHPRMGLRGKKIAFIDPGSLEGLTVELSEP